MLRFYINGQKLVLNIEFISYVSDQTLSFFVFWFCNSVCLQAVYYNPALNADRFLSMYS
jgi:hypothetical protein